MDACPDAATATLLRRLFDDYLRMYASRDDRLTAMFSEDFSGFTGGGDFLVKSREEWVAITRQDFAQVKEPIRIELKDVSLLSLSSTIAVTTGFFTIHLPIKDHVLSRETARLVLVFRHEATGWKISHSSISIPYSLVKAGEVYPLRELTERTQFLENLVTDRTAQLSSANATLQQTNAKLAREIEGHRRTEAALQQSEERYRSILNASPDDITITDCDGHILMVSPVSWTIFRSTPAPAFLGSSVFDFVIPEDRPRALANVARRREGFVTGPAEYRGLRPDGSIFDIEVNSDFIRDGTGTPTGMVLIVRDITERKEAEAERKRLEAQNRLLQKSESLARMAGAIAHHFNNQLLAVMGYLELAISDLPRGTEAAGCLGEAMQSARKAARVSRLMLTYLGHAESTRTPVDLAELCRQCLPPLETNLPGTAALVLDLPSPGPSIRADATQLRQLLTNLVTNAREASVDHRLNTVRLTVTTLPAAAIPTEARFPIDWQPVDPAYACLAVSDTGCGITAHDLDKLFDPFFSSKFTGRGLGLPVVLGIARAHDGAVTVDSTPGEGSTFRVYLPLTEDAAAAPRGLPPHGSRPPLV